MHWVWFPILTTNKAIATQLPALRENLCFLLKVNMAVPFPQWWSSFFLFSIFMSWFGLHKFPYITSMKKPGVSFLSLTSIPLEPKLLSLLMWLSLLDISGACISLQVWVFWTKWEGSLSGAPLCCKPSFLQVLALHLSTAFHWTWFLGPSAVSASILYCPGVY